MTLTDRSMDWLNQNRYRSYPLERDGWRARASPSSGLDCVILDATVFDADASGDETLELESIEVSAGSTVVGMAYGGRKFSIDIDGSEVSGEGSFKIFRGIIHGGKSRDASVSIVTSSHAYIVERTGVGSWDIGCRFLKSRIVSLSDGFGMDGVSTMGSEGVAGHEDGSVASGDVVLEDGYRTSPIIANGEVLVRVGRRYGYDPCKFDFGDEGSVDCRKPLFFFCGQNAVNGGNIVLSGGKGVSVMNGGEYRVRSGTCRGKTVPCIEIVAGRELLEMCGASE